MSGSDVLGFIGLAFDLSGDVMQPIWCHFHFPGLQGSKKRRKCLLCTNGVFIDFLCDFELNSKAKISDIIWLKISKKTSKKP